MLLTYTLETHCGHSVCNAAQNPTMGTPQFGEHAQVKSPEMPKNTNYKTAKKVAKATSTTTTKSKQCCKQVRRPENAHTKVSVTIGDIWSRPPPLPTPMSKPPHPPVGGAGERCSPRGLTRWRRPISLKCSWGTEVLSTPQDLPSTRTPPAGGALCAAPPVFLWVSQGAPQTTRLGHAPHTPRGFSHGPQVTRPTDSPNGRSVGLPCPAAGARSTGHAQSPTQRHTIPTPHPAYGQTAPPCAGQSAPREAAGGPGASQRCDPACPRPPAPLHPPPPPPSTHGQHTQAQQYLPPTSALVGFGGRQQSGRL